MRQQTHPIATEDNVAAYRLTSFHYGTPGAGRKVYIQASLHADEVPAMLVAHFLRRELDRLDAAGKVRGEIILVPAANPIGLSQVIHGAPFGRFDLASGVNFNRAYRHVADALKVSLEGKLGPDAAANAALVRVSASAGVITPCWRNHANTGSHSCGCFCGRLHRVSASATIPCVVAAICSVGVWGMAAILPCNRSQMSAGVVTSVARGMNQSHLRRLARLLSQSFRRFLATGCPACASRNPLIAASSSSLGFCSRSRRNRAASR